MQIDTQEYLAWFILFELIYLGVGAKNTKHLELHSFTRQIQLASATVKKPSITSLGVYHPRYLHVSYIEYPKKKLQHTLTSMELPTKNYNYSH